MACETCTTFTPVTIQSGPMLIAQLYIVGWNFQMAGFQALYPTHPCSTIKYFMDALAGNFPTSPSEPYTNDSFVSSDFSFVHTLGVSRNYAFTINASLNGTPAGQWDVTVDSLGNVNIVDNTTFGVANMAALPLLQIYVFGPPSDTLTTITVNSPRNVLNSVDPDCLLGCLIPACGAPAPAPKHVTPPGIKLVNFSRFVNPFGIKGRF